MFDRAPDAEGLAFWNRVAEAGHGLDYMAARFVVAPEFAVVYGQPDNPSFVRSLYENILDRAGEAEGVSFWTAALNEGRADRAAIVVQFSESPEHIAQMGASSAPEPVPIPPDSPNIMIGTHLGDRIYAMSERGTTIYGMEGDDQLHGGNGNDTFIGGPGGDSMYGGPGADVFRFEALQHMDGDFVMPGGSDDVLDFRGLGLTYRGAAAFVADGTAQLRYEVQFTPWGRPGTQYLQADANGDGAVDYTAILGGAVYADTVLV